MDKLVDAQDIMNTIKDVVSGDNESEDFEEKKRSVNAYIPTMEEMLAERSEERKMRSISYLVQHWEVAYYREVENTKPVSFIKKVIRKLMKFCLLPIVEDQNANNANILQVLNAQNQEIKLLKKEIELLKSRG